MPPAYEWYQTEGEVVVVVKFKEPVNEVQNLDCNPASFVLKVALQSGVAEELRMSMLHKIRPEQCSAKLAGNKVEVHLAKDAAVHWEKLELMPVLNAQQSGSDCHSYPTSSVKGPKNWDKIAKEALEGENNQNDLINFFQNIYGDLDDDGKRAMVKSMVESKGTVLSTNWDEVGKKEVEVKPPDGVEYKPL